MNVLHLWMSDSPAIGGGGAGSMLRLHTALRQSGLNSAMLCETSVSGAPAVHTMPPLRSGERLLRKVTTRLGLNDVHRLSSFQLAAHPAYREADIVNFHGLLGGFVNYLALPRLTAQKPAVLTLRSMWCMTGHCGFSLDCERWKSGCGRCPYPEAHPAVRRDATRLEWRLKSWAFNRSRLTLVPLSRWLAQQCQESLLSNLPIRTIANGVDIADYQPLDQELCRSQLGLPPDRKVLMFMAVSLASYRKGADLLVRALAALPEGLKKELVLLLVGNQSRELVDAVGIDAVDLGYVSHPRLKSIAYSAADLFVMPSRGESFGQVILESLACGTPVAGFRLGPMPELIRPGSTGLLAAPEDPLDLARQLAATLGDPALLQRLRAGSRQLALEYSTEREAQEYIRLYDSILGQGAPQVSPGGGS